MNKYLVGGIGGFILGLLVMMFAMYQMAPGMMLLEDQASYDDFDTAVAELEKSILEHGWKIPKVHDLQMSMKGFGKEVKPVKVFEICEPNHAEKILRQEGERIVASMMPCRIAVYEKEGKVFVSRMNSGLMASMMDGVIPEVMSQASKENEEILKAILK